jgi:DNA polymerase III, epsilon subunit and related 3'-5' exonucleases
MARKKHPGQRNSLDALCQRYGVDNSSRDLHGALLDAEILADVYLTMTGGQATLVLQSENREVGSDSSWVTGERVPVQRAVGGIPVIRPTSQECKAHEAFLDLLESRSDGALWRNNHGPS